ncbi:MAG: class I SAM-dependent methyltransferase [Candidatus Dormibacteraeota bacterium]|nr:class I SAM-dependent methyltransferase [Candidatus Dormibacteraeota bacterium]
MSGDIDLTRALSFGAVAEEYDRVRPSYPPALVDDLVALHPRAVLDVGAGTGKASELLFARGLDVLAVEADARMAAIVERKGIAVEVSTFQDWDARGRTFDLITAGQSWHWMPQPESANRAVALLRPGGHLAAFWNLGMLDERTMTVLDAVYTDVAPAMAQGSRAMSQAIDEQRQHIDSLRDAGFAPIELRTYPGSTTYTAREWVELIATHSNHATLPVQQREALLRGVADAITQLGGTVTEEACTALILATRA